MTAAHARSLCCRDCPAGIEHAAHHDRLLTVDVDTGALLALFEMAVTWHELDYSELPVIGPAAWPTFADAHDWTHPDRAARAFGLALDIVGGSVPGALPEPALATVIDLMRS